MLRTSLAVLVALACSAFLGAQEKPVVDLLAGGRPDGTHDWTLGPTGARGWMAHERLQTSGARQILVTEVAAGSPADGVLAVGDVLVGLDGRPFASDARKSLGAAIGAAEGSADGALRLVRVRGGASEDVVVKLPRLGAWADSAPFACAKTEAVLAAACRHIASKGFDDGVQGCVDALALLAAGTREQQPLVAVHAWKVAAKMPGRSPTLGMTAWEWGWAGMFLGEYHLATGDASVLPAIRAYALAMARGQSGVGTWGHGMAKDNEVKSLGGYGALNQAGLGCWVALALARRCGVDEPEVAQALERAGRFFRFYVGKGSVPYGDHPPYWELHDNNGKNAQAAIGFALLGDDEAARWFARMTTASYEERELGHTGNYFGFLWGQVGAGLAGEEAAAAHLRELRWFYDLARGHDGSFRYQGGAGEHDSFEGWDATGAQVLGLSVPLRRLHMTGKLATGRLRLSADEVRSTIEDGRGFQPSHPKQAYHAQSAEELCQRLRSWSPVVRFRAATALAKKPGDHVPQLLELLASKDEHARLGACQALEYQGKRAAPAVDALAALLVEGDTWLRIRAAYALAGIGAPARGAAPQLLRLSLEEDRTDPRATLRRYLSLALFVGGAIDDGPHRGLLADSVEGVDRELLREAVQRMLRLDDGLARSSVAGVYQRLAPEDLEPLWPAILQASGSPAPSGEMFADGVRLAGIQLLARHRIREGMRACLDYARTQNPWDSQERMWTILAALKTYGAHAKRHLPELEALAQACRDERDFPDDCKAKKTAAVEDAIAAIGKATELPELRSLSRDGAGDARKVVKVYVLAGQSNMQGHAVADLDPEWRRADYNDGRGTLEVVMARPENRAAYAHLKDAQGRWTVREDVWARYKLEDGRFKRGPLTTGFTPFAEHHFGPELQFGHVVGDAHEEQVLLVKTAWGGKSLYEDFRPPSAPGETGKYWSLMVAQVKEALADLAVDFAAKDMRAELAGFVWYQGWNDGCGPKSAVDEYESNLVHLIRDVRLEFAAPRLPVVVGELTGPWVQAEGEWDRLRKAQAAAAAREEFRGTVVFVPTHDFVRAPEDSPHPGHGHHEYGNAETIYLVGDALGRGMLELERAAAVK